MKTVRIVGEYKLDFETAATFLPSPMTDDTTAIAPPRPPGTGWRLMHVISDQHGRLGRAVVFYWERLKSHTVVRRAKK